MWRSIAHVIQVVPAFPQGIKQRARVSVEGRCLTPSTAQHSTARNVARTQKAFEKITPAEKRRKRLRVMSSFVRPRPHFACRSVPVIQHAARRDAHRGRGGCSCRQWSQSKAFKKRNLHNNGKFQTAKERE